MTTHTRIITPRSFNDVWDGDVQGIFLSDDGICSLQCGDTVILYEQHGLRRLSCEIAHVYPGIGMAYVSFAHVAQWLDREVTP